MMVIHLVHYWGIAWALLQAGTKEYDSVMWWAIGRAIGRVVAMETPKVSE
jgi:hypothetical protein